MSRWGEKQDAAAPEGRPARPSRTLRSTGTVLVGVASFAAVPFLLLSPMALAAPPANDDFAEREVLSGSLPIEVSRSNVGATEEGGEDISFFAAGHSVWFEWEAAATEWVTIGACGSDFPAVIGVFTGSDVASLTRVVSGNSAEGPHCLFPEREYTFKAQAGSDYVIGADGNSFGFPEELAPTVEGTVELRIESTPPPANDDFANPADLTPTGKIYELERVTRSVP